jgi:endonuclease/exonuclease/phosphatase (EEP) superfamily protein YafD
LGVVTVLAMGRQRADSNVINVLWWLLVLPGLIWVVVRLVGYERGPLAQLIAFTPYVAGWSLLPLAVSLALRRWWVAGVAGVVVLALAWIVVPRWIGSGSPASAAGARTVRVLTANLLLGQADATAVLDLVRGHDVDLAAFQEYTPEAEAAFDRAGIGSLLPYRETHPASGGGGSAVYSRFPLRDGGVRANECGFLQAYAVAAVPGARPVVFESAHPSAPYNLKNLDCWRSDLAAQPAATDPPATPDGPLRVLAGDLNSTLDHRALRSVIRRGYRDAAATVGKGLVGTWGPYDGSRVPPVTIDHVLVDRRIGVRDVSVHGIPGSDHRAILADLAVGE